MLRKGRAIVAGFAVFELVILVALFAARTGWPAYREAEALRAYSLTMLVARLMDGTGLPKRSSSLFLFDKRVKPWAG